MDKETLRDDAITILKELGHAEYSDDAYSKYPDNTYCEYDFGGLYIRADHLPYHDNPRDSIPYIQDVKVNIDGKHVFNTKTGHYEPGEWETILHELRIKIPALRRKWAEERELLRKGNEFFEKNLYFIFNDMKIGEDIEIKNGRYFLHEYPYGKDYLERKIFYKGKLVLRASKEDNRTDSYHVSEYIPGEWEKPVEEAAQKIKAELEERKRNYVDKRLVYLRSLK